MATESNHTYTLKWRSGSLTVDGESGAPLSFMSHGRECLARSGANSAFVITTLDSEGNRQTWSATDAMSVEIASDEDRIVLAYRELAGQPIDVEVMVHAVHEDAAMHWGVSVDNQTPLLLERIALPPLAVPNDLVGTGGDAQLFWPAQEGVVIEDVSLRGNRPWWLQHQPIAYPSKGWGGSYPGATQMPFFAYYGKQGGMYFAAHDPTHSPKHIDWFMTDNGDIQLDMQIFIAEQGPGRWDMPFPVVMRGLAPGADWQDAAETYRDWVEANSITLPQKVRDREAAGELPKWLDGSPIVVCYPVRGEGDHLGELEPNEYYPYTQALEPLEQLSRSLDSHVMPMLMHWEGTAPWAPPYCWPPMGDLENFKQFVETLHERGHMIGLYGSGMSWTQQSHMVPSYNREAQFEQEELAKYMCAGENGQLHAIICSNENPEHGQRVGYEMCPCEQNTWVHDIIRNTIRSISEAGVDYVQYFDQNLGGGPSWCYSREHGHPGAPGPWTVCDMRKLLQQVRDTLAEAGHQHTLIGCESAAGEPYIDQLVFNDLRPNMNFPFGKPVPAYNYVYHEYVQNYMGNQVDVLNLAIDATKSPENHLLRATMSFIAGDFLTVVMGKGGEVQWAWVVTWDVPAPPQEPILALLRNMNAWRRGWAKQWLRLGRMTKPWTVATDADYTLHLTDGHTQKYPTVLTSRWHSESGEEIQIFANYLEHPQEVTLSVPAGYVPDAYRVLYDPYVYETSRAKVINDNLLVFELPALSVAAIAKA